MKKGTISVMAAITGAVAGGAIVGKAYAKAAEEKEGKINKFKQYYSILNRWLKLKHEGQSLEEYFLFNGYKTIAVYGMGEIGSRLYEELKGRNIEIKYAIDKQAEVAYAEIEVLTLEDKLPKVDAVIVTAVFDFDEIAMKLKSVMDSPVISFEDVIYAM